MPTPLLYLRDLPRYENIREAAKRYPDIDPESVAVYLLLLRVANDIGDTIHAYLEEHGISHGRFTVMMILNRHPEEGLSPAELADKSGVTRATMTGLLDGLEKDGRVARESHATDRRMLLVRLTPLGRHYLDGILPGYLQNINQAMARLSEAEKHMLAGLLAKLGGHELVGDAGSAGAVGF